MDDHLRNKVKAREVKENAKKRCDSNESFFAAVYDMQQVLQTPQLEASQLYYRRKLSVYNLSIYDLCKKKGYCYMWDETKGQRGSNEVASCVSKLIKQKVLEGKKEICFFSDNCGGQNLNRNIVLMYADLASQLKIKITHCFLEKGHTQNEGDSVHSCIERASKNVPIYVPSQWYLIARTACRKTPYEVIEMEEFYNYSELRKNWCNAMDKDEDGEKVKWQKVRIIMVDPNKENSVFVKYDYEGNFVKLNTEQRKRRRNSETRNPVLQTLYSGGLPISRNKLQDLKYFCNKKIIPAVYHDFYMNIRSE